VGSLTNLETKICLVSKMIFNLVIITTNYFFLSKIVFYFIIFFNVCNMLIKIKTRLSITQCNKVLTKLPIILEIVIGRTINNAKLIIIVDFVAPRETMKGI